MYRLLMNWLRKKLGVHVCEEFTQWTVIHRFSMPIKASQFNEDVSRAVQSSIERGHFTSRIQERTCTICGKVEQQELK